MEQLSAWESFYVIAGTAAGALIGLQFVVVTLIANKPASRLADANAAFTTPTIVHFMFVLLFSAAASAPWDTIVGIALVWVAFGVVGMLYIVLVNRRVTLQTAYTPVLEDQIFHLALPFVAYAMLVIAAYVASDHARIAMFGVGTSMLLLLFVGIHNTWDAITYHVFSKEAENPEKLRSEDL